MKPTKMKTGARRMSNSTARQVMTEAISQTGVTESPANSNRTKYGKAFGSNGVPWCSIFEWWCGNEAPGSNPIPHNFNAAYCQDDVVGKKGGTWIMKKTASNDTKKAGLSKVKYGDVIDFDFGKNNLTRQHTGFAIGRSGEYYITIEGNTSTTEKGSQSNGGCVAIRRRHYKEVCSIARPKYGKEPAYTLPGACPVDAPKLPARGYFKKGDSGANVGRLQKCLNWATGSGLAVDKQFGNMSLAAIIWFQVKNGLTPDGQFGKASLKALNKMINAAKASGAVTRSLGAAVTTKATSAATTGSTAKSTAKTKREKLKAKAKAIAWPYGTSSKKRGYPNGKPTAAYKKALNQAYPNRSSWGKQTRAGASCDVAVGATVRASGVDKKFPRGLDEIMPYLKTKRGKKIWKKVKLKKKTQLKLGDITYQIKKSGAGHVTIVTSETRLMNAHYYGKSYPVIEKISSKIWNPSACKKSYIIRPR